MNPKSKLPAQAVDHGAKTVVLFLDSLSPFAFFLALARTKDGCSEQERSENEMTCMARIHGVHILALVCKGTARRVRKVRDVSVVGAIGEGGVIYCDWRRESIRGST